MRITDESELAKLIKNPGGSNLWLFCGDESYLKAHYRGMLLDRLLTKEQREFDLSEFEAAFSSAGDVAEALQVFPIVSERRIVSLTGLNPDAEKDGDNFEKLLSAVRDVPESAVLILTAADDVELKINDKKKKAPEKMGKLISSAEKSGVFVYLTARNRTDLLAFVKRELKKYNATAENYVCYTLIDLCRQDMQTLENECAKLGAYAANGILTEDDLHELVHVNAEDNAYYIVDNITSGNIPLAVKRVRNLFLTGTQPLLITSAIVSCYLDLTRASAAQGARVPFEQAAENFGYGKNLAWKIEKAYGRVSRLRSGYATDCLRLALRADMNAKSGRTDAETLLVRLVGDLAAVRK